MMGNGNVFFMKNKKNKRKKPKQKEYSPLFDEE